MICGNCKNYIFNKCEKFGTHKTDSEIVAEKYACFEQRFYKTNKSYREFTCDENIYTEIMSDSEIKEAIAHCNRIRDIDKSIVKG